MILYHFTCSHGAAAIGKHGTLRPNANSLFGVPKIVWLTDQAQPKRDEVGLTSTILKCDRMEVRYRVVDNDRGVRWDDWKLKNVRRDTIQTLESFAGDGPRHWWVTERPIKVKRD